MGGVSEPGSAAAPGIAQWHEARLAAIATATATMNHGLRGALSAAMLAADRLTMSRDADVRQAGEVIVRAVQRATAIAQQTLELVREGAPKPARERVDLWALIDGAAAVPAGCAVNNVLAPNSFVEADRAALHRVFTILVGNAAAAGARTIAVTSNGQGQAVTITVQDDAGGLSAVAQQNLFRVAHHADGTPHGLKLATARDLMRAQGGDLRLGGSGPRGSAFIVHILAPIAEGG